MLAALVLKKNPPPQKKSNSKNQPTVLGTDSQGVYMER